LPSELINLFYVKKLSTLRKKFTAILGVWLSFVIKTLETSEINMKDRISSHYAFAAGA
jgi:hypothetical protein